MSDTHDELSIFPLELRTIRKTYRNGKSALHDVSITINRGEIIGLLGLNGAGKSTTLKVLATILKPTSGSFTVGPRRSDVSTLTESELLALKQKLAWFPERPLLYNMLTAREYIRFVGRLIGIERVELGRRIEELLNSLRLLDAADDFIRTYSYGMQRKVSLAACMINNPDLLLLDEPTSGIDPEGIQVLEDIIRTAQKQNRSVILSTHVLETAGRLCDHIVILHEGRSCFTGSVAELRSELMAPSNATLKDLFLDLVRQREEAELPSGVQQKKI